MRAVWLKEFGGPEVLVAGDAPDPVPDSGQALVAVAYANITFVETQFRAGPVGPFRAGRGGPFVAEPPMIPGNGVGGAVIAVGPDVDPGLVGREVTTSTGGSGGYAELVAVDAAGLVDVPPGLPLDAAVALLADGRTATWLVHAASPRAGERVLVEAAAGGVGTLLVQLVRSAGAVAVAVAGGSRKLEVVRALGTDLTVDYLQPDWTERVRTAVGGVDIVLDGVGGDIGRSAFELLDVGGRMLSFGLSSGEWAPVSDDAAAARGVQILRPPAPSPAEARRFTERALAEAAAGRLRPVIGQRYPLDGAADAHAAIEGRKTVGKTLLQVR
jgi:NADPH:quinone reductase